MPIPFPAWLLPAAVALQVALPALPAGAAAPAAPAAAPTPAQFAVDALLMRTPDVSETQLVFGWDGDLWLAPRDGGSAYRLTSAAGAERLPKFSPDGTKVAFMADYDGNTDLYIIGVEGGAPERVTFHPGRETLSGWTPDGESLLYFSSEASGIARAPKILSVPATGGSPTALPVPYGTFADIDPTGTWLAYTPLSRENRTWRRYRGGMAQDIWLFNLKTSESRRVTDDPGTDRMPMWNGDKLIFQSDRGPKGIANFYEYDPASGETQSLTTFAASGVRFPSIGPKDIVFEQGGGLFRYALDSGEIERVSVSIPGDRPALRPVAMDLSDALTNVRLSKSGKRLAVEARGEIFSVPAEEGVTRNLTRTSGVAEREPSLSPDGRWVAYWSDRTGEYELTIRHADGSKGEGTDDGGERTLTATGGGWKGMPRWSPNGERIAWSDHNGVVSMVEVAAGTDGAPVVLARGHDPQYLDFDWSPDSNWIAWSTQSSTTRLSALFLTEAGTGTIHEITSGLFDDAEPVFSRCGKWLFFHSARTFSPSYADIDETWIYEDARGLFALPLNGDVELPWAPKNVEEDIDDEEEGDSETEDSDSGDAGDSSDASSEDSNEASSPDGDAKDESDGESSEDEPLEIDLDGVEARIVALPLEPGVAGGLVGLDGGLLFARFGDSGAAAFKFSMEGHEDGEAMVLSPISEYQLSHDGSKLLVNSGGRWGIVAPEPSQSIEDAVDFSGVRGRFDAREEWPQMIHDVHRMYRDWFYDKEMHGVDWDGQRDRALGALGAATSRADVHFLIGEMLAELNVGHAYNRPPTAGFGRESNRAPVGLLGADFVAVEGGFQIERIVGSPNETDGRGPLHGLAAAGDVLTAVDGAPVDTTRSLHEHMLGTAGRTTVLTLETAGESREVVVEPARSERSIRYRDWVAAKRALVHGATDGRVGYIHVPSTGIDGQNELYRQFMAERSRDALIIDERWNSGGQIPTRFIELLNRKPTNVWAMRDGKAFDWPPVYHDGPKVMLINHSAGSGGDAFPWYFRQLGLGKLIGTRTWGGLVGISGNPALVDGASPSVPTFAFYELDGTWGVEGHGVDPDIEVLDDPALMTGGEDPQLQRALAELRTAMEGWTYSRPDRPAPPVRSGAGIPDSDR